MVIISRTFTSATRRRILLGMTYNNRNAGLLLLYNIKYVAQLEYSLKTKIDSLIMFKKKPNVRYTIIFMDR